MPGGTLATPHGPVRLNAYLARAGVASRRRADELILAGRVRVNDVQGELNMIVGAHDVVEVDGRRVERQGRVRAPEQADRCRDDGKRPRGTADRPRSRTEVPRVVPVGRLDIDTTGAAPDERRRPRTPSRASALRGSEGLRGRRRGLAFGRGSREASRRRRARRRDDVAGGSAHPGARGSLDAARAHAARGRNRQVKRMCEAWVIRSGACDARVTRASTSKGSRSGNRAS